MSKNETIDYSKIKKAAIYPSIGVMRVGNSEDYFIGPLDTEPIVRDPSFYRDTTGRLKRQATEFRIYGLDENDEIICELTDCKDSKIEIEWNVQLANQKSEWYGFGIALDIPEAKDYPASFKRNLNYSDRSQLIIQSELLKLPTKENTSTDFTGNIKGKKVYLGTMKLADKGTRLHILGGKGVADNIERDTEKKVIPATTFANNDNWYDDISDGPVTATVKINGSTESLEVAPAWVICAPPDYAPLQKSVRTMWDLMRDIQTTNYDTQIKTYINKIEKIERAILANDELLGDTHCFEDIKGEIDCTIHSDVNAPEIDLQFIKQKVRTLVDTKNEQEKELAKLKKKRFKLTPLYPSFKNDILPIFQRMTDLQWVNKGFDETFGYNKAYDFRNEKTVAKLRDGSRTNHTFRQNLYNEFRQIDLPGSQSPVLWPWLYGDNIKLSKDTTPNQHTTLTKVQLDYLAKWVKGDFIDDYNDTKDKLSIEEEAQMLTRAALDYCLADAFHPGCEMTWPVRMSTMYVDEFRFAHATDMNILNHINYGESIDHTIVEYEDIDIFKGQVAGGITRWMAVPWQTDTSSCRDGYDSSYSNYIPTFWPARVPNEILSYEQFTQLKKMENHQTETTNKLTQKLYSIRKEWLEDLPDNPNKLSPASDVINKMIWNFDRVGIVVEQSLKLPNIPDQVQVAYVKDENHLYEIYMEYTHILKISEPRDEKELRDLIQKLTEDDSNLIGNTIDEIQKRIDFSKNIPNILLHSPFLPPLLKVVPQNLEEIIADVKNHKSISLIKPGEHYLTIAEKFREIYQ